MAIQSGNDDDTVQKDVSYSPSSGRETEQAQDTASDSAHLADPEIDASQINSLPGEGGPDDAGDIDVDDEAIRENIARRSAK